MPSLHSIPPVGSSSRLHRTAALIRAAGANCQRGSVAAGLVEAHDQVARSVVGVLDAADLDAAVVDRDDRFWCAISVAGDDSQRQVQRLGLVQHVVQPGTVREHADGHRVAAVVGVGSGYLAARSSDTRNSAVLNTVAVAAVVEHGDAERRLAEVDEAVGAHLELGRVPRAARMSRRLT